MSVPVPEYQPLSEAVEVDLVATPRRFTVAWVDPAGDYHAYTETCEDDETMEVIDQRLRLFRQALWVDPW